MSKKIKIGIVTGIVVMSLMGCGSKSVTKTESSADDRKQSSEKITFKSEIGQMKKTDDLEITVESAEIVDNPLNTDLGHSTLKVQVKAKNISKDTAAIGTPDFKIIDAQGKEFQFTSSEDNFGDEVKSGDTIEGAGYYSIPNDVMQGVIVYNPKDTTIQLKWDAKFKDITDASESNK